jgi:hypothetical protein
MSLGASLGTSFLAIDRCDRCGAQAYVETRTHSQGIAQTGLLWCAHDYAERQFALLAAGARVVRDGRKALVSAT